MKKILGLIIISVFVICLFASASPAFKDQVQNLKNNPKYASSHLPLPPTVGFHQNLADSEENNSVKLANTNTDLKIQSEDIQFAEK